MSVEYKFNTLTIFFLLVGVTLLTVSLVSYGSVTKKKYYTTVRETNASSIRSGEQVYNFQNLSSRSKEVFLKGHKNLGQEVIFRGREIQPPEFEYYDDTSWYTYVEYKNGYYNIVTEEGNCPNMPCLLWKIILGFLGLVGTISLGYGLFLSIDVNS